MDTVCTSHPPPALPPRDLVHVANGFSRMLWAIPLALFLVTGALEFAWTHYIQLPSYVLAALCYYWGLTSLYRVQLPARPWRAHLRTGTALAFLLIYFAPFVYWQTRMPHADHFVINCFALLLAMVWILWIINKLAESFARQLADRTFLIEARLCAWSVLAFMALPVILYGVYSLWMVIRHEAQLYLMVHNLRYLPHGYWVYALFLLPLTLTMSMAWKSKQRALALLQAPHCSSLIHDQ